VGECPVQLEAVLEAEHGLAASDPARAGHLVAFELRIVRVHVHESIRMDGHDDRIDPDRWRPLIMSFTQFYGLGERVHHSTLAEIPESAYRPRPAEVR
jgi:flavin reductase (DIM6/NTAB) family NADH-FMN oxidoreductase RutF